MRRSTLCILALLLLPLSESILFAQVLDAFSAVPPDQRAAIAKRLDMYVDAYRHSNWEKLYGTISATGKGTADAHTFILVMTSSHGEDFSNYPDLKVFRPTRTFSNADGYDTYGCAEAEREGEQYGGVAVVHAVFEQQNWFFTGWTFIDADCADLSDPKWQPTNPLKWDKPMQEFATAH
jgi:hypothetical protein